MNFIKSINERRRVLKKEVKEIAAFIGMKTENVYRILSSGRDMRASTLDGFADALDAKWMLVPKHLIPEVERLISGKAIGPDDVPSSIDLLLGDKP